MITPKILDQQKDLHVSQMDEPLRAWPAWCWRTVPYHTKVYYVRHLDFRVQTGVSYSVGPCPCHVALHHTVT